MNWIGSIWQIVWSTDGVSEFASALLGGVFAVGVQQMAAWHDRRKDAKKAADEKKAQAWAIFFKLSTIHEALTSALADIERDRKSAEAAKAELWQFLQFPPHDWREVQWEIAELLVLIDHKKLDLMRRYQEATVWLSNFIQSSKLYREMRVEFFRSRSSSVEGDMGTMRLTKAEYDAVMPTIVHLRSLADSISSVIPVQQRDGRHLLVEYAEAMKELIGHRPNLEFADEKSRAATGNA